MKLYEGMFLVDNRLAKKDEEAAIQLLTDIITRFDSEVVDANKWAERKLAYPIEKQTRGTYFLVHFNAPPEAIKKINHQSQLTAEILRQLIVVDEDGPAPEKVEEEVVTEETTDGAEVETTETDAPVAEATETEGEKTDGELQ